MDPTRIKRESLTVTGRDQESGAGAETLDARHIGGAPDVIDDNQHPRARQQLAEPRSGGGYSFKGRGFLVSSPGSDEVPYFGQTAVGVGVLAHRRPKDTVRVGLPDSRILADRLC